MKLHRNFVCVSGICLGLLAFGLPLALGTETLRIATWNMNNLHYEIGVSLRDRAPIRNTQDYALLRKYAKRLHADIVAFQEVNGPKAARLVFPEAQYDLFFSGRYVEDVETGQDTDHIYTGFAVRRGVFDAISKRDVSEISIQHTDSRPTRWGTEVVVEKEGKRLALLNVHLKSGCFRFNLEHPRSDHCVTLAKQRQPLDAWIDDHTKNKIPFVILGDFNRAFDVFGESDHLWENMDDGDPEGLELRRLPESRESDCWKGTRNHHKNPIDFLVFDEQAWTFVDQSTFQQLTYDPSDQDVSQKTPSDHCPIVVELNL